MTCQATGSKTSEVVQLSEVKVKAAAMRVAAVFAGAAGLSVGQVFGRGRTGDVSRVRQLTAAVLRTELNVSYPQLGRALGVHHTSAMHAVRQGRRIARAELLRPGFAETLTMAQLAANNVKGKKP